MRLDRDGFGSLHPKESLGYGLIYHLIRHGDFLARKVQALRSTKEYGTVLSYMIMSLRSRGYSDIKVDFPRNLVLF